MRAFVETNPPGEEDERSCETRTRELVRAMKAIARRVQDGEVEASALNADDLERELWTAELPPVDLIIRTSGENRVSNFLLWQGAYAEYVFTETLWPDFRAHELLDCIEHFQNRERRFGLTSAQLRAIP